MQIEHAEFSRNFLLIRTFPDFLALHLHLKSVSSLRN